MAKQTLLLLSGPPRCGKDTCAAILREHYGLPAEKFSAPLKAAVQGMLSMSPEEMERVKDKPLTYLGLPSPRQLQIDLSENLWKPLYGKDIFAKLLYAKLCANPAPIVVISDCGFKEEVEYLVAREKFDIYLVQLYRQGTSYEGDSRSRIKLQSFDQLPSSPNLVLQEYTIPNTGTFTSLTRELIHFMDTVVYQPEEQ